jgi:transmembrane sensor
MEDRNNKLIAAYFDKTIDDDGLAELKEWLESSEENQHIFSDTIRILTASKSFFVPPVKQEASWSRIAAHIAATKDKSADLTNPPSALVDETLIPGSASALQLYNVKNWLIAALTFFGISTAALVTYQQFATKQVIPVTYTSLSNPEGRSSRVTLPDGSIIHLGAGSKISYEKSFSGKKRMISLDGEAFFDVKHKADRPFVVKSGKVSTVVLGTSFNIKAFSAAARILVTVNSGKVGVMTNVKGKSGVVNFLLPDEQLEISTADGVVVKNTINASAVSGWTENNFVYYNTSLKDITSSLARHYGVKFNIADEQLGKIKLTAKFNNMPLAEVTDNLEQLSGLSFKLHNKEITVLRHLQKRRAKMK